MTTTYPTNARVAIIIDVRNEPLHTTLAWARRSAHHLTRQLWEHGVLAHVARVEIDDLSASRHPTPDATDEDDVPVIGLDMDEAIELIEILEDLAAWIDDTAAVRASWHRRTGGTVPAARLCADLLGWAELLGTRPPLPHTHPDDRPDRNDRPDGEPAPRDENPPSTPHNPST